MRMKQRGRYHSSDLRQRRVRQHLLMLALCQLFVQHVVLLLEGRDVGLQLGDGPEICHRRMAVSQRNPCIASAT